MKHNYYTILYYCSSRLKTYFKQLKDKPWLIGLQKTYSVVCLLQKYFSLMVFICFLSLVVFAQISYSTSFEEGDENYAPMVPQEDLPFFATLFLKALPNVSQALGELIILPDPYGVMDEDSFSGPLKTQLRRDLLWRWVYLNFRARVWAEHRGERIRDNVDLDYKVSSENYSLWHKAPTNSETGESQDEN